MEHLVEKSKLAGACMLSGALLAGVAVAAGALGAHGLRQLLPHWYPDDWQTKLGNWETAARYQLIHGLACLVIGIMSLQRRCTWLAVSGGCFLLGSLLFSGCLFLWVLTDAKTLVMPVPLGGVLLIGGWIALAAYSFGWIRRKKTDSTQS